MTKQMQIKVRISNTADRGPVAAPADFFVKSYLGRP
jgi:hypothetical protein